MNNPQHTSRILKENDLRAKKHLGQNFLVSEKALNKIITAGNIQESDFVLEIGPGTGNLTKLIFQKTKNFLAIEKDTDMQEILKEFPVQFSDAMQFDPIDLPKGYKVIANIPYYITSPLISHYLKEQFQNKNGNPPKLMVLLVQKEVAEKICDPKYNSYLSLGIRTFGKPSIAGIVKKGCFLPMPKVDSAILKIEVYDDPLVSCDFDQYFKICSMAFANPRKKLSNNLKPYYQELEMTAEEFSAKTGIDLNLRAEKLTPQDFEKIVNLGT
jgi:16S rRNA (adenine1518-N6/adenine1519-N6)-dimethyltransferase